MSDELAPDKKSEKRDSEDSPKDETVDQLKEDLEKADEKIKKVEEKIIEQQKKTFQLSNSKSEGMTLVLSIVVGLMGLMGVGHIYLGRIKRGVTILLIGIFIWSLLFLPPALMLIGDLPNDESTMNEMISSMYGIYAVVVIGIIAYFIWQVLNARKLCKEYNKYLEEHEEPLW